MMRFGNLHGSVLGLEVVLPDGTILDNLNTNRKDNTGYHLKNLFIGSEGTLGFITGVSILAVRKRPVINVMILALPSFPSVVQAYAHAKRDLSEIIAAFEVMDQDSVLCVKNARAQWPEGEPLPVDDSAAFYCIVETAGSVREHDNELYIYLVYVIDAGTLRISINYLQKVDRFISKLKGEGVITDGSIARSKDRVSTSEHIGPLSSSAFPSIIASDLLSSTQIKSFWSWRERLPGTIVSTAPTTIHFDISMPLPILYTVVEDTRAWLREKGWLGTEILAVYGYGHVGDGNLHLTIPAARDEEWLRKALDDFVYEWTVQRNGSISAEHGLGFMKAPYLSHAKPPLVIDTMFRIKALFDPNGIMNPYKVLPSEDDRKIGEGVRKRIGAVAERCGC
ncbi:FAD-linked oxidase-like protein [Jimgerdemannia flammicorona]|nr:FAD-linked oxidase-like protein [Jimgerdemannia flammicorona]